MFKQQNLIYLYDGSFAGFLCCVFESFAHKETPLEVIAKDKWEPALFDTKIIETHTAHTDRVNNWLHYKLPDAAKSMVQQCFLASFERKEFHMLVFLQLCHLYKANALQMLQQESVLVLNKAIVTLGREASKWMGLVRFSDYNGFLAGVFEPTAFILPLLQNHFCDRFSTESFLLYDKTHQVALISEHGVGRLVEIEGFELPKTTTEDSTIRALWKQFHSTIAVKERINPHLQINNMPKKYWKYLVEFHAEELTEAPSVSFLQ